MATTPPPPSRVRTPPAPLHGSRYDDYEPYSPRRSARVSAKRECLRSSPEAGPSRVNVNSQHHQTLTSTPAPRKGALIRQASSQTLSPPSSPETSHRHLTPLPKKSAPTARHTPTRSQLIVEQEMGNDQTVAMLPTPNKTPSKRVTTAVSSTARILNFKAASLEDILPTPRKRKQPLTLESFDEQHARKGSKVEIFTDSQDRVPKVELSDDNPFVGRKRAVTPSGPSKNRKAKEIEKTAEEHEMEEAVRNDEGVFYMFRGKKVFRRFQSPGSGSDSDAHAEPVLREDANILHQAGPAAHRPFTRSSLTPRLLFPSAEQAAQAIEDEEALTDIEDEHNAHLSVSDDFQTPQKQQILPSTVAGPGQLTPDSRSVKRKSTRIIGMQPIEEERMDQTPSVHLERPQVKAKKTSPFDSWQRTKPGMASSSAGRKRAAPAEEEGVVGKRTRSTAQ